MVYDRPKRPSHSPQSPATNRPNPAIQRTNSSQPQKAPASGTGGGSGSGGTGNRGSRGGSGSSGNRPERNENSGRGNNELQPSPWLDHPLHPDGISPTFDATASFIEYLRWMRSPDNNYKDPTKVQILQMSEENANYRDRLTQLTQRTKLIAGEGNYFQVKCSWRLRVGGHRGPESILLPAFDALGMPYIPSSTLRGAARNQAIRHFIATEKIDWKTAEQKIASFFGSLDASRSDHTGKVIFLDAYPLPSQSEPGAGLSVDLANNIWNWKGEMLDYSPNPNPFFSLEKSTFLIGIRRQANCDDATFEQIKQWLSKGLQRGIGSQVNTGYGRLVQAGQKKESDQFFQVEFSLEGQLIHGRQKFTHWNWNDRRNEWQMRGQAEAEVRPVAFKSMLRYWFRVLTLGVIPATETKRWEANLFGAINPQTLGWVSTQIFEGQIIRHEARATLQGKSDPCGEQAGVLILSYSEEVPVSSKVAVGELFTNLAWLMFHLGGIGQGARRPSYSRQERERAPWWRGSTLIPDSEDEFWQLPDTVQAFQKLFCQRLDSFYRALSKLTVHSVNPRLPLTLGQVKNDRWTEAVDSNCRIVVCAGDSRNKKPYALSVLHDPAFKKGQDYDGDLCGKVVRGVKPSPVWIADLDNYQVVTVFGATQDPRKNYLQQLRDRTARNNYAQLFPLTNK